MYVGRTVFAQVMHSLPLRRFHTCVRRYDGNHKVKTFSCLDQFRVMAFAQLTYRESLRDIEACLRATRPKLYHMGIRSAVPRNTLANANEVRDWRIYADFAQVLIGRAQRLYAGEDFGEQLARATLYALDASTIDLCLSLFPRVPFRRTKAAIKLHTLSVRWGATCADDSLLPATFNAVERGNRRHRKMQKTIYRVRSGPNIRQRTAVDMFRDAQAQGPRPMADDLHAS